MTRADGYIVFSVTLLAISAAGAVGFSSGRHSTAQYTAKDIRLAMMCATVHESREDSGMWPIMPDDMAKECWGYMTAGLSAKDIAGQRCFEIYNNRQHDAHGALPYSVDAYRKMDECFSAIEKK